MGENSVIVMLHNKMRHLNNKRRALSRALDTRQLLKADREYMQERLYEVKNQLAELARTADNMDRKLGSNPDFVRDACAFARKAKYA